MVAEKKSKRLATVEKLAQLKEDVAARYLGSTLTELENGRQQLRLLQEYREQNQQHIRTVGKNNVSGQQLQRHQLFLQQLETAVAQQLQRLALMEQQVEKAKQNWQQLHYRHKAIGDYVEKIKRVEDLETDKAEQKEMDDRPIRPDQW